MPDDQPKSDTEYDENWEKRRHQNEFGAASVEYGLLIAGIAVLIIAVVLAVGTQTNLLYMAVDWPGVED